MLLKPLTTWALELWESPHRLCLDLPAMLNISYGYVVVHLQLMPAMSIVRLRWGLPDVT
jgi:hypothetical protein